MKEFEDGRTLQEFEDQLLAKERPITLEDRKHYLRVLLGISFFQTQKKMLGLAPLVREAGEAIKKGDNKRLQTLRRSLDEADHRIITHMLHGTDLPR